MRIDLVADRTLSPLYWHADRDPTSIVARTFCGKKLTNVLRTYALRPYVRSAINPLYFCLDCLRPVMQDRLWD